MSRIVVVIPNWKEIESEFFSFVAERICLFFEDYGVRAISSELVCHGHETDYKFHADDYLILLGDGVKFIHESHLVNHCDGKIAKTGNIIDDMRQMEVLIDLICYTLTICFGNITNDKAQDLKKAAFEICNKMLEKAE